MSCTSAAVTSTKSVTVRHCVRTRQSRRTDFRKPPIAAANSTTLGFRNRDETGYMRSVSPGCQFVHPDGETTVRSEERLLESFV
jgi:hypothetical protein